MRLYYLAHITNYCYSSSVICIAALKAEAQGLKWSRSRPKPKRSAAKPAARVRVKPSSRYSVLPMQTTIAPLEQTLPDELECYLSPPVAS